MAIDLEQNLQQLDNSTRLRRIFFQPSIGRFVLRGIQPLPKVCAIVLQRGKELCGRLLQVPDVAEGQIVGVMIQNDYIFAWACALLDQSPKQSYQTSVHVKKH